MTAVAPGAARTVGPAGAQPLRIDVHVHLAGLGTNGSGISTSARFRRSFGFRLAARALGASGRDRIGADRAYVEELARQVRESKAVDKVVVLALDGLWRDGGLDRAHSPLVVPNDWAMAAARRHPEFLFGASVNPLRPDALDELHRGAEAGAVLMKWLPNVMGFDPADSSLAPFLRVLADLKMPLLCHAGPEFTLAGGRHALGDPIRLRPALDEGVTVIAAHCATLGRSRLADGRRVASWKVLAAMTEEYPNLHADLAALTSPLRGWCLRRVLAEPRLAARLIDASDFPVPSWPLTQLGHVPLRQLWALRRISNWFDRERALKAAAGVTDAMTTRAGKLLRMPEPVR